MATPAGGIPTNLGTSLFPGYFCSLTTCPNAIEPYPTTPGVCGTGTQALILYRKLCRRSWQRRICHWLLYNATTGAVTKAVGCSGGGASLGGAGSITTANNMREIQASLRISF